jgi:glyoxylase-like metal-dependent hydrolase (beta-lactamase superfamily II)
MSLMDRIRVFTGGIIPCNGYLVQTDPNSFIAIDAPEGFANWIKSKRPDVVISDLFITHQHFDHIIDAAAMKATFGCKIHAFAPYSPDLTLADMAAKDWNIDLDIAPFDVDHLITESGIHEIGDILWDVRPVPGHSTDSLVFCAPDLEFLFSGDTLFADSIGRTDFPGGNGKQLLLGIKQKIMTFPPTTTIFPGHGPYTSLRNEQLTNPYLS